MGIKILNKSGKDFIAQKKQEMLAEIKKRKEIRKKKFSSAFSVILWLFFFGAVISGLCLVGYFLYIIFSESLKETESDINQKNITISYKEKVSRIFNLKGSSFEGRENFYAISPLILKEMKHDSFTYDLNKNSFLSVEYNTTCLDKDATLDKGCNLDVEYRYINTKINDLLSNRYSEVYSYKLHPIENNKIIVSSSVEKLGGGISQFFDSQNNYTKMFSNIFSFVSKNDISNLENKLLKLENHIKLNSLKEKKYQVLINRLEPKTNNEGKKNSNIIENTKLNIGTYERNELLKTFDLSSLEINETNNFLSIIPFVINKKISDTANYKLGNTNNLLVTNYETDCLPILYSGSNNGQKELLNKILSSGCTIKVTQEYLKNLKKNVYETIGIKTFNYYLNFDNTGNVDNNKIVVNLDIKNDGDVSYFSNVDEHNDFLNRLFYRSSKNSIVLANDIRSYREYFRK